MNSDRAEPSELVSRVGPSRAKLFSKRAASLSFDIAKRNEKVLSTKKVYCVSAQLPCLQVEVPARALSGWRP